MWLLFKLAIILSERYTRTMNNEDQNKPKLGSIREVEKQLYAKNIKVKDYVRHGFRDPYTSTKIQTSWTEEGSSNEVERVEQQKKKRTPLTLFSKLLISSVLFFMFSVLAAFLVFTFNTNQIAYDAVRVSVLGPNSVAGGEELTFDIAIANDNPVDIILTDVIVNYPSGTITADTDALPLVQDIQTIDELRSGLEESVRFRAVLFGAEDEEKEMNIVFQYRVPDSDNIFFKERSYKVKLEKAPVVITTNHEPRFQNGSKVHIDVSVTSNAPVPLRNLFMSIDYPFGFEFSSSTPRGLDSSSFRIGDLGPGESYDLVLEGIIRGQNEEQRTLRYTLGSEDKKREGSVGTVFTVNESHLSISKPPITLAVVANTDESELYIAEPGERVKLSIDFANSLQTKLLDNMITVVLDGSVYDPSTVRARDGFYRSSSNTISWNQNDLASLAELEPGETGVLEFSLEMLPSDQLVGRVTEPEISLSIEAEATNFELGGEETRVNSQTNQRIKIATEPVINTYLLHSTGPLPTDGPIEPQVGQITTYTLVAQVSNTTNPLEETLVRMTLPRYVEFQENLIPQSADVDYDRRTREIIWRPGPIEPGTGYTKPAQEIFLSLTFEPSLDQLQSIPVLVKEIKMQALDQFTQVIVTDTALDLTTELVQDPAFDLSIDPRVQ